MWRGYKIGPDWEFTEPEEWKLLWKSNTINCEVFQHFSASLSPSQSPFPSCSSQTTLTATTSGPQPSFLSFLIFPLFSKLFCSCTSACLFLPSHLFSFNFSPTLSLYLSSLCFSCLLPYSLLYLIPFSKLLCFPSCVLHPHSFADTNDHIRQMTLITVHLECKTTERWCPKHLLHTPNAFRNFHLLCTLLSSKK